MIMTLVTMMITTLVVMTMILVTMTNSMMVFFEFLHSPKKLLWDVPEAVIATSGGPYTITVFEVLPELNQKHVKAELLEIALSEKPFDQE